ncbi:hypothetical protein AGMMS50239_22910 [Bacteroidia bacterium]|nr:hypothetical protein AGMMS50239_22910 [Bacteroidia bacterium]
MSKEINLYRSKKIELPSLTDEAQSELSKGWSLSYVYFLRELRDIFLLIEKYGYGNKSFILSKCKEEKLASEGNMDWTERNILERMNALINFDLISKEGKIKHPNIFQSTLGSELTIEDKKVFKKIFFSYFRFREIISWMIDPREENRLKIMNAINEDFCINNSQVMFSFISDGRFTDSFFFELKDNADIFFINEKNSDLMRFWDVFVKWGMTLDLLDKFQLKWADVTIMQKVRSLSCVYFKKDIANDFSLIEFIRKNYKSDYIYIPQLVLDIVMRYNYSIEGIKEMIINQSIENINLISMQRTSEIFIEEKEKILLPMYRNAYISHLLML